LNASPATVRSSAGRLLPSLRSGARSTRHAARSEGRRMIAERRAAGPDIGAACRVLRAARRNDAHGGEQRSGSGAGADARVLGGDAMARSTAAGRARRRNLRNGLLFISPWLVGFLCFTLYPFLASLYFGFCNYDILSPPRWAGLANYRELLTD